MKVGMVVKKIVKTKHSNIIRRQESSQKYSKALYELIEYYPELEEKKIIMLRDINKNYFDSKIKKVVDGYDLVNFEIEKYGDENVEEIYHHDNLSMGDAIKYKPFFGSIKRIMRSCLSRSLHFYPSTIGSSVARQDLVDYLIKEGFPDSESEFCSGISVHNVAFASSTTQAFYMILKTIAREHDTILMTAPNYGIFASMAEKLGVHVETINLKEENDFFIDPFDLSRKIDSVNRKLQRKYSNNLDYTPKCVAYLNINPHNPIDNVMTEDDISLINKIGNICLKKGVFIIDDLIYRDLTYDRDKLAFPIGSIPRFFNNTISLFGLSKSFGLVSFRAGFIVMPTPIFWGYATQMFDFMDSISVLQVEAVRGAYNGSKGRYRNYDRYFNKIIPKYLYQLDLVYALIYGIDSIKNKKTRKRIEMDVKKYSKDKNAVNQILKGIKGVYIRNKTYPKSGFFVIVDFTSLKGKYYKNKKIVTEYDLLKAMFNFGKIRYLMGENFVWPYQNEFVSRINFAIDKNALIHNFYKINGLVRELKNGPNKKKNI